MTQARNLAVVVSFAFLASVGGCSRAAEPTKQVEYQLADPEYDHYLRNASVQQLMDDVRNKLPKDKPSLRPEIWALAQRGLPVFLEVADYFLDDNEDVRDATWCVIVQISQKHSGYAPPRGWSTEQQKQWQEVWVNGDLNAHNAKGLEERRALVTRWKQWYADNVERKGKT